MRPAVWRGCHSQMKPGRFQLDVAVGLTTRMLAEAADHPEHGRAEALRRSMLALMDDRENDHFAHPLFWAPFVVVGEGGAPMRTAP